MRHFHQPVLLAVALSAGWAMPVQAQTAGPASKQAASSAPDEWTVKPRGRLQLDYGNVSGPSFDLPVNRAELGPDTRVRRAYLGVDITAPGGKFGARIEADFAANPITLTDAYLFYKATKELTITAGHFKPYLGIEEQTSDNFTSFQERASFTSGFGFERRLGIGAAYVGKTVVLQGGVFTDDTTALGFPSSGSVVPRDLDDAYSLMGRAVFMPKIGGGTLHVGGSVNFREFKNLESVRYRARPFVRTTDIRFVDTRNIAGTGGELGLGTELAYIHGPFHFSGESYWQKARRPALFDPTFNGGYAEVGYVLTGEATPYKAGIFERLAPKKPLGKGGFGAVQVNVRYDWLDLNSGTIVGGHQDMAGISLVWAPHKQFRFVANYGHFWVKDSPITANGGNRNFEADAFGLRGQFDF